MKRPCSRLVIEFSRRIRMLDSPGVFAGNRSREAPPLPSDFRLTVICLCGFIALPGKMATLSPPTKLKSGNQVHLKNANGPWHIHC